MDIIQQDTCEQTLYQVVTSCFWPSPAPPLSTWKITGHIPLTIDSTPANNIRVLGLTEKDIITMMFSCGSKEIGSKYCPEMDAHEQKIAECSCILRWMGMVHL